MAAQLAKRINLKLKNKKAALLTVYRNMWFHCNRQQFWYYLINRSFFHLALLIKMECAVYALEGIVWCKGGGVRWWEKEQWYVGTRSCLTANGPPTLVLTSPCHYSSPQLWGVRCTPSSSPHPPSIFRVTLLSGDKSRRQSKNHQSWPGQRGGRFWQASVFPAFTNGADLTFKRPLLLLPLPHPPLHGVQGCWKEWDQRRNISQARWISTFKPMECLCLSFSWARPFCSQLAIWRLGFAGDGPRGSDLDPLPGKCGMTDTGMLLEWIWAILCCKHVGKDRLGDVTIETRRS